MCCYRHLGTFVGERVGRRAGMAVTVRQYRCDRCGKRYDRPALGYSRIAKLRKSEVRDLEQRLTDRDRKIEDLYNEIGRLADLLSASPASPALVRTQQQLAHAKETIHMLEELVTTLAIS